VRVRRRACSLLTLRRDLPPTGGFESIKYKRNLPFRGPGAYVILGTVTAVCAYGFYRLGQGNLERRCVCVWCCQVLLTIHSELERERAWSRIHLVPLLLAEGDRDLFRRQQAAIAREQTIMKDVPGWEVRRSAWFGSLAHFLQVGKSVYSA